MDNQAENITTYDYDEGFMSENRADALDDNSIKEMLGASLAELADGETLTVQIVRKDRTQTEIEAINNITDQ